MAAEALTTIFKTIPIEHHIRKFYYRKHGIEPLFDFQFNSYKSNVTGGNELEGTIDFSNINKQYSYIITDIFLLTTDTNSQLVTIEMATGDWTLWRSESDRTIILYSTPITASAILNTSKYNDQKLDKPIKLGQPYLGGTNPGVIKAYFSVGTATKGYTLLIKGTAFKSTLPNLLFNT